MRKIFFVTGEASGDLLAAEAIRALQDLESQISISAIGGKAIEQTGAKIIMPSDTLCFMGFVNVLRHIPSIMRHLKTIKRYLQQAQPDLIVLVDFYGFNIKIAKIAKTLGIKVLFYVSPKIWAWHYKRIFKLKKYVDHMALLFPFEKTYYDAVNLPCSVVGHPMNDLIAENDTDRFSNKTIALLPGSRRQEIKYLLPVLQDTVKMLQAKDPRLTFLCPVANNIAANSLKDLEDLGVTLCTEGTKAVMQQASAAIVCSGTATLETALYGVPQVIIYKTDGLSFWLAKRLVKLKHIGLCNIVAEADVAPELIQGDACASRIGAMVFNLVNDHAAYLAAVEKTKWVRERLGPKQAAINIAKQIIQEIP